jgi:hypothetical protein
MKVGNIENRKYGFSYKQYERIYDLYKDNKTYNEIASIVGTTHSRVSAVLSHINSVIIAEEKKLNKMLFDKDEFKGRGSSFKELIFPADNEPTIGNVVIKDGKIIQDGEDITVKFRTLKHYF